MSKERWNERYGKSDYAYGTEPNEFYKQQLSSLAKGKILLPADGEGRNGVYAATEGWDVTSFDMSDAGKIKALNLAQMKNVKINYLVSTIDEFEFEKDYFDALVLIFVHLPENVRERYHQKLLTFLKPGGVVILEAFSKEQINFNSGGPSDVNLLYDEAILKNDFKSLSSVNITKAITQLEEGQFHKGEASVIRLVGTK